MAKMGKALKEKLMGEQPTEPKPERKKRERKALIVYRVLEPGHEDLGVELGNKMVILLPITSVSDLKDATGRIKNMETGNFAVGRLTFLEVKEEPSVKKVVVQS